MGKTSFTFKSSERLKKRKYIEALFSSGKALSHYPYKALYMIQANDTESNDATLQFGISVPKKRFKNAVTRNLLKRRTREAWRLNKFSLQHKLESNGLSIRIFFIYQSSEILEFKTLESSMQKLIQKLDKLPLTQD